MGKFYFGKQGGNYVRFNNETDHGDHSASSAVFADRHGGRMPGVLIIEALAQTGAVAILSVEENRGKTAYFAGINSAKFKRKVVPGDVLILETEIIKQKGPIGVGRATAKVGDDIACIAELTFAIS